MRLKQLRLRNFQGHEKLVLDFSDTITTIIGPTDAGKSAILRALRWLCQNDFPGTDFIREGAEETRVSLVLETDKGDEFKITRVRGKDNLYLLNDREFRAFGSTVPDQIRLLLRLNEINFQSQHDAPFWFTESAAEVSRRLNNVIDLSVIDSTLSNVSNAARKAQLLIGIVKSRLDTIHERKEKLEPQRSRIEQFEKLRKLNANKSRKETDCSALAKVVASVRANQASQLESKAGDAAAVLRLAKAVFETQADLERLRLSVVRIVKAKKAIIEIPDPAPVDKAFSNAQAVGARCNILADLIDAVRIRRKEVEQAELTAQAAHKELEKQSKGENCPLCGNQIQ